MKYTAQDYPVQIWYSAEDKAFIAQVLDMPGISAFGGTREDAAREIGIVLETVLKIDREDGTEPPVPGSHKTRKAAEARKPRRLNKLYVTQDGSFGLTGTRDKPVVRYGTPAKAVGDARGSAARPKPKNRLPSVLIK
jgi:predicted RNase H-like HicB family nuclease